MAFIVFIAFGNSFKGVKKCKKVSFATDVFNSVLKVSSSMKFSIFRPSFGLQFYTSFHLASLGTTWYKIYGIIPTNSNENVISQKRLLILF